jgi:hypothetical protein
VRIKELEEILQQVKINERSLLNFKANTEKVRNDLEGAIIGMHANIYLFHNAAAIVIVQNNRIQMHVTHDFGRHDDVLIMVYSSSSLELSPEKSYLHLFPEITVLRKVRRLLIHLPARMHDSRRLP